MRLTRKFASLAIGLLFAGAMAYAQGVGASGDIRGKITDPSGAVVQKVTVTATDTAKGIKHTAVTDEYGDYLLRGLLPGTYNVSTQISGFQTAIQKGVVVNVGETLPLDFHLRVSQATESVEVTTEPPAVNTEQGAQANVIDQRSIQDLPINRRDYLEFSLLAPAVADTHLASDQDFRVKQTPQSGLSFYGSNGRGNSVTVDGGEANDDSGGVRLTIGQDAVQEFQINRSNYSAELGGASGASINIVSKTGGNMVHGSLFGFFRSDVFDARNPFSFSPALASGQAFNPAAPDVKGTPIKDNLSRQQYGATLGGPITSDKTFFFASFEGLHQDAQNAAPLLTTTNIFRLQSSPLNNQQAIITGLATLPGNPAVPCLTGQPALPAATCAGILTNVLTVSNGSPLGTFLINQFEQNSGVFDYNTREYLLSGRLDHVFNENNQGYLRYSFGHDLEENPDVQALTGFSRGSSIHAYDNTAQAAWFHTFSPRMQNELRGQFNYSTFNVLANSPSQVGLDIPGFGNFGSNIFLPSLTIMRRYEAADNLSITKGRHALKMGFYELIRGNHTESHTFFPGRFVFGALPGGVLSPCLQVPAACGLTASPAVIDSLQSAALGLPQFYQQGFGNPIYTYTRPWTSVYFQDAWSMKPNFILTLGARYEVDQQYGSLNTDKNNIAPRISFAWDPWSDHKTAIRGGYGIYYSPVYGQIGNVVQTLGVDSNGNRQIAQLFVSLRGGIPGNPTLTSAAVFQTLFAQGKVQCTMAAPGQAACITPADLTQFGMTVTHSGPLPPFTVIFGGQPGYRNPYSQQGELGVEHELGKGLSVSASGIYVHTIGLPVALDANLLPAPITTGLSPLTGQPVSFRNWAAPGCGATLTNCFVNPLILQNNIYSSAGSALYEGGILEVNKRFSNHYSLMANYTYSKTYDTNTDFNTDYAPADQTNLAGDRALSDFDQRHKVVVAFTGETPWSSSSDSALRRIFANFQMTPILRYASGHPFNILAGTDVNGDRHSTSDRPLGVGRNTGKGPDFFSLDMRLSRSVKVGESAAVSFMAEAFDLFNRTNFGTVNNINPGQITSVNPSEIDPTISGIGNTPFSFVSATRRQMQFGARLTF